MKENWFYEGTNYTRTIDYIVTFAEDEYMVDIFDIGVSNHHQAYLDTFCFNSLIEAKTEMAHYKYPE